MENDSLIKFIDECTQSLDESKPILYEAYFFKIYVAFEKYLGELFLKYCLGDVSSKGYQPDRRLHFDDEKQIEIILNSGNSQNYTDYLKKIETMSKHIFNKNPFNIILEYAENVTLLNQMKSIRNFVAHESNHAKKRYVENCLGNGTFKPPCEFLLSLHKGKSISYYTLYVNKIKEISNQLLNPPDDVI